MPTRPPTDLRALQRRDQQVLAVWVVIFLVMVGGAVIALVYGWGAAALGVMCLLGGAGLFGLLWLIVSLIERWAGE
jgi:fucose permease